MIKLSLNKFSIMIKDKIFWPEFYQFFIDYTCSSLYAGNTASYFPLFISPTSPCHKRPQWLSVPAALSEFVREELTAMGWHQTARGHQDSEEVIFPPKPLSPYWAREVITLDIKSSFVKTLIWKCDGVKWGCEASGISWGFFEKKRWIW